MAQGFWGGERTLNIVPDETKTVCTIFELYREHRSAWKVNREVESLC